jgi:hypothetical protein
MEFKKFTAGFYSYGKSIVDPERKQWNADPAITNVNFEDEQFWEHFRDKTHHNYSYI